MKLKYILSVSLVLPVMMSSCSDFTEIDSKGNNLLASTNDLELLLNTEYNFDPTDMAEVCGDYIYSYQLLSQHIMVPTKSKKSIRLTWDEDAWVNTLPMLTSSDDNYTTCYDYIGKIANPILIQIDAASGEQAEKDAIKAEAYLIRAYFHLIAIQKFAPAYNPATAENTVGLAYMKETLDIKVPPVPVSMKEYYGNILSDIESAENLNALSEKPINYMRFGKGALKAVKALTLMSMQRYDEAAVAAREALDVNSTVVNYFNCLGITFASRDNNSEPEPVPVFVRPKLNCPEDYFVTSESNFSNCLTPYTISLIEPGHIFNKYLNISGIIMNQEERDKKSESSLGERGYWITEMDNDSWFGSAGLRTTQMYLILAETEIHAGRYDSAMGYIDKIREKRIESTVYIPLQGTNPDKDTAIRNFKMTAQSEGILTIWNFVNHKRWTLLDDWKETIHRNICGIDMELAPESKCWVFPIPVNVVGNNPNFKPFMN